MLKRLCRTLCVSLLLCPLLGGCVDYDLGIRFDSQTQGYLTQTLHVSDRILPLGNTDRDAFFQQIISQTQALSGSANRLDDTTLNVTLPFSNGEQLVERFNRQANLLSSLPGAPVVNTHLALQQNNYLFALRNHLTYSLNIDEFEAFAASDTFNDFSWLTLTFHLTTPWGVTSTGPSAPTSPAPTIEGHTATWHLAANQPQQIEAVFWIPSPIGIGAGAIALFCILGERLKYQLLANVTPSEAPKQLEPKQ